jgi:phenylacetic acid degradation operon negative regulatory protein
LTGPVRSYYTTIVTSSTDSANGLFADGAVEIPTRTLVLGMAHADGTILAREVYPVAEACTLSPEQVRSCLRRLVGEGLFTRDGEGRDATFAATDAGVRVLEGMVERTRLAYAQDAAGRGWDRRWRLVAFAIPETKRAARDAFRDQLLALGGAAVQNGLYVSAHPWDDDVIATAARLDVTDHVTLASTDDLEVGGVRDPRALAEALWDLTTIADRYQEFIDVYSGIPEDLERMRRDKQRLTEADFLPGALYIGLRFQECFNEDPLLPPELLPRPWPGREARDLLLRSRRLGVLVREAHDRPLLFSFYDAIGDQRS